MPVEQEVQVQNFRVLTVLTPYFLQSPPRAVAVVENHQATEPTAALAVAVAEARAALLAAPATLQAFLRHKEATAEMGLALRLQILPLVAAVVAALQQLELMPAQA